MNSSLSSRVSPGAPAPLTHEAVLEWLAGLHRSLRAAAFVELFDFEGIDLIDLMLSPLYATALNTLRDDNTQPEPPVRRLADPLRAWAYLRKLAWRERAAARRSPPMGRVEALLWTRHVTHTVNLWPVAVALRKRGVACSLMACQANIFEDLQRNNIDSVYTMRAWPKAVRSARREGARRAKALAAIEHWPIPPFENRQGNRLERAIRDIILQQMPHVCESVANVRTALDVSGCRVLVVGNDLTVEGRAGCRVAARRGVPTAVFMHGSITAMPLHSMHCADRLMVFGEGQRRDLTRLGIAADRVVVGGAPSLDNQQSQTGRIHPRIEERFGLRAGEPWILVATSGPGHTVSQAHHGRVVAKLLRLSKALPELPLVIKLHRKDRPDNYQESLRTGAASKKLFVVPDGTAGLPTNILEWLQGCTMVLTGASSVAIEAMLMEVPVVTMDFLGEIKNADFIDAGATVHVETYEALEAAVRGILAEGGAPDAVRRHAEAFVKDAFLALDGGSADRGARVVAELAAAKNPK